MWGLVKAIVLKKTHARFRQHLIINIQDNEKFIKC
jgi:hypothetical protein